MNRSKELILRMNLKNRLTSQDTRQVTREKNLVLFCCINTLEKQVERSHHLYISLVELCRFSMISFLLDRSVPYLIISRKHFKNT